MVLIEPENVMLSVAFILPDTSNLELGLFLPIPTLPDGKIDNTLYAKA